MSTAETIELPRRPGRCSDPRAGSRSPPGCCCSPAWHWRCAIPSAATAPLALTGAGTVLALFVLVPRGSAGAPASGRSSPARCSPSRRCSLVGLFGFLFDGRHVTDLSWLTNLLFALVPLAVIALAATGGLVLLADDLRARLGVARPGVTPWQRLAGTADAPAPAPWRALGGLALVGLAGILALGFASHVRAATASSTCCSCSPSRAACSPSSGSRS